MGGHVSTPALAEAAGCIRHHVVVRAAGATHARALAQGTEVRAVAEASAVVLLLRAAVGTVVSTPRLEARPVPTVGPPTRLAATGPKRIRALAEPRGQAAGLVPPSAPRHVAHGRRPTKATPLRPTAPAKVTQTQDPKVVMLGVPVAKAAQGRGIEAHVALGEARTVQVAAIAAGAASAAQVAADDAGQAVPPVGPAPVAGRVAQQEEGHTVAPPQTVPPSFVAPQAREVLLLHAARPVGPTLGLPLRELEMLPLKARRLIARVPTPAHLLPASVGVSGAAPRRVAAITSVEEEAQGAMRQRPLVLLVRLLHVRGVVAPTAARGVATPATLRSSPTAPSRVIAPAVGQVVAVSGAPSPTVARRGLAAPGSTPPREIMTATAMRRPTLDRGLGSHDCRASAVRKLGWGLIGHTPGNRGVGPHGWVPTGWSVRLCSVWLTAVRQRAFAAAPSPYVPWPARATRLGASGKSSSHQLLDLTSSCACSEFRGNTSVTSASYPSVLSSRWPPP